LTIIGPISNRIILNIHISIKRKKSSQIILFHNIQMASVKKLLRAQSAKPDDKCVKCSDANKTNQHRLNSLLLPITYQDRKIITNLKLPRKYTSTHNDETSEIYMSIGHEYNKLLLSSEEVVKLQSQVVGSWVEKDCGYEIHLTVLVSTEQNPQSPFRNLVFCEELGVVLEGIAFAETSLLSIYPNLGSTKVYIHFKSIDPIYDRVEYWGKLKYWQ
jgi:hypothetical protein